MESITSTADAGVMRVLVSSEHRGTHDPKAWARVTMDALIEPDPAMTALRAAIYRKIEAEMLRVVEEAFRQITAASSAADIETLAQSVCSEIMHDTLSTPWAANFSYPLIADKILATIRRNLLTAANEMAATE